MRSFKDLTRCAVFTHFNLLTSSANIICAVISLDRHCRLCFPDHLNNYSGDRNRSLHDSGLDCSGLGCFSDFIEESDATESTVDDILTLPRSCVCVSKLFADGTDDSKKRNTFFLISVNYC